MYTYVMVKALQSLQPALPLCQNTKMKDLVVLKLTAGILLLLILKRGKGIEGVLSVFLPFFLSVFLLFFSSSIYTVSFSHTYMHPHTRKHTQTHTQTRLPSLYSLSFPSLFLGGAVERN